MLRLKKCLLTGFISILAVSVSAQQEPQSEQNRQDQQNRQEQQNDDNEQENQQNRNDEQQKAEEYNQISQRLRTVQQQALSDIQIAEKTNNFSAKVDSEMIKQDPSAQKKLEERDNIVDDYEAAEKEGDNEKMEEIRRKFQALSQDLIILQQRAMQNDELREEGEELEKAVLKKMTDIDPEVPKLIARLETLGSELQGNGQDTYE